MKTFLLLLPLLFLKPIQGNEVVIPETSEIKLQPESFAYGRIGAFSFLVIPVGVEAAIGYRFRSEGFGWGPLLNVSAAKYFGVYESLPCISLKCEVLFYPKSWGKWYWGFMPGVSLAHGRYESNRHTKWEFIPNLEVVFGKEFEVFNKKQFYYFSISPVGVISYNYGWSF